MSTHDYTTDQAVLVVPCPAWAPTPMLAFSPEHMIGATPRGRRQPGVLWLKVTAEGVPVEPAEEPAKDSPIADLILYRLAEAYTALVLAGSDDESPTWKA
jgi:hypothetical protein